MNVASNTKIVNVCIFFDSIQRHEFRGHNTKEPLINRHSGRSAAETRNKSGTGSAGMTGHTPE